MFESSSFMCERVIKITEVNLFSKLDRHRVSKSQGELLSDSSSDLKASRPQEERSTVIICQRYIYSRCFNNAIKLKLFERVL